MGVLDAAHLPLERMRRARGVLLWHAVHVSRDVIEQQLPQCEVIVRIGDHHRACVDSSCSDAGTGYDNVDVEAAGDNGIMVCLAADCA